MTLHFEQICAFLSPFPFKSLDMSRNALGDAWQQKEIAAKKLIPYEYAVLIFVKDQKQSSILRI